MLMKILFPFGPSVDDESANPFMPKDPEIVAEKGIQVPLLIGGTNREGLIFYFSSNNNLN